MTLAVPQDGRRKNESSYRSDSDRGTCEPAFSWTVPESGGPIGQAKASNGQFPLRGSPY
jgi:hypothetical protein